MKIEIEETELADLRAQLEASKATLSMVAARLGGIVEGQPTGAHNPLQRVDALAATEAELASLRAEVAQRRPTVENVSEAIVEMVTATWDLDSADVARVGSESYDIIARLYAVHALEVRGLRGALEDVRAVAKAVAAAESALAASSPSERLPKIVEALEAARDAIIWAGSATYPLVREGNGWRDMARSGEKATP